MCITDLMEMHRLAFQQSSEDRIFEVQVVFLSNCEKEKHVDDICSRQGTSGSMKS